MYPIYIETVPFPRMSLKTINDIPHMCYTNYVQGITIAFHPEKNRNYTVTATDNNRMNVYGTSENLNLTSLAHGWYPVEEIIVSSDLSGTDFNSGNYETIFIYLDNSVTSPASITYSVTKNVDESVGQMLSTVEVVKKAYDSAKAEASRALEQIITIDDYIGRQTEKVAVHTIPFSKMALKTVEGIPNMEYTDNVDARGVTIAFHPTKERNYSVGAYNNNRLNVYGTSESLDLENLDYGFYPVESIIVSSDLSGADFNSGNYETIFIYLDNSKGDPTLITYNVLVEQPSSSFHEKTYPYQRITMGCISSSNIDGTKNFDFTNGTCLIFNPEENYNYIVEADGNNRLRVYGTLAYYDAKTVYESSPIVVDVINESPNLNSCSFNSNEYQTIFIYLDQAWKDTVSGSVYSINETTVTETLEKLLYKKDDGLSEDIEKKIKYLQYGMVPDIPTDIPTTAIDYHACWDGMVESGAVTRSEAYYMSTDTDHIYPLYTYTVKFNNKYIEPDYSISENELSDIYVRPKVLIVSGHHGDEICTPWALLHFFKRMIEDHYYRSILGKYEWTIVPLVNPVGFNNRRRYNAQGRDINRDYNDSTGFVTEEAQYVRDVFLSNKYVFSLDLHQVPNADSDKSEDRHDLGFTSMNIKRASESQEAYNKIHDTFCNYAVGAGANTDRDMLVRYDLTDIDQTAYLWDSSNANGNTYKNYVSGNVGNINHKDNAVIFSATLETQTDCMYLSHTKRNYNPVAIQYTNVYANEIILAAIKTYEELHIAT